MVFIVLHIPLHPNFCIVNMQANCQHCHALGRNEPELWFASHPESQSAPRSLIANASFTSPTLLLQVIRSRPHTPLSGISVTTAMEEYSHEVYLVSLAVISNLH